MLGLRVVYRRSYAREMLGLHVDYGRITPEEMSGSGPEATKRSALGAVHTDKTV